MTEEVYSVKITLQVTDKMFRNLFLAVEERPSDEAGPSKRKHVPRQMPDALSGCLCGIVVDSQSDGVLECKKLGCGTQWVRLSIFHTKKVLYHSSTFM